MRIEVTERDIRLGRPRRAFTCPVARAVKRATGARTVGVDDVVITLDMAREFETPKKVRDFIGKLDFDGRRGLKPFSFTLPIKAKR